MGLIAANICKIVTLKIIRSLNGCGKNNKLFLKTNTINTDIMDINSKEWKINLKEEIIRI